MMECKEKLTLAEIKSLYEYCSDNFRKPGITVEWSKIIYKNLELLTTPYKQIIDGLYDEMKDQSFLEYNQKVGNLLDKYADRDSQGNIIMNPNTKLPEINEMIVEFTKDNEKLNEEYKETISKIDNKNEINNKFLSQVATVNIFKIEEQKIPNVIPPYIVSIICV